jgi:type II secretory ATPase GspE/PulE/Tfp pilus assembly ATPase PilB-like protein
VLEELCNKPRGLVLVTGPTGSGKSTTLAAMIDKINREQHYHIITVEDPIEYLHSHKSCLINQREVGTDTRGFKQSLKHILRQDPDVVLIGEMRDLETIEAALVTAETGHLVFATLHTNSAPESITRLLDMGMDPFNFSDALLGILAQRLAKRMCSCKQAYTPDGAELTAFLREYCDELMATSRFKADPKGAMEAVYKDWIRAYGNDKGQLTFYKTVGCDKCGGSGFKGRCGLHELLIASDRLKKAIQEHARVAEMLAICLEEGMRTLKQDGMEKCLMGVTHMKEVRAVCVK